jgi:hypothetical protein
MRAGESAEARSPRSSPPIRARRCARSGWSTEGRAAAHTGGGCVAHAGHRTGPGWTVQANMMLNPTVPDAMADAYTGTDGDFLDRLLAALDAAQAEGGDIRGQQAAALVVSSRRDPSPTGAAPPGRGPRRPLDRAEKTGRPAPRLQEGLDRADGCTKRELRRRSSPRSSAPDAIAPANTEVNLLARGHAQRCSATRAVAPRSTRSSGAHPDWREFIRRLVAAGVGPRLARDPGHHRPDPNDPIEMRL